MLYVLYSYYHSSSERPPFGIPVQLHFYLSKGVFLLRNSKAFSEPLHSRGFSLTKTNPFRKTERDYKFNKKLVADIR